MIPRYILHEIDTLLKQFPAVAIGGARQIGKSTLAMHIARQRKQKVLYYDLELPSDRRKLDDMENLFTTHADKLIIIDEAQTMPELFTVLRPIIDAGRKAGRFLLLSSVSPFLMRHVSQTLAGRVAHIQLPGINITEAEKVKIDYKKLWFRGGYPEPLTLRTNEQWQLWMYNYEKTFVERDVTMLMNESLSPATVRRLWSMLASISGQLLNYEDLSRSLGMSRATVVKYMNFMEGAYLIRRLQPWFMNTSKRIVKSPKIYFRDSGLLHYMNRVDSYDHLTHHIVCGASWEGFVIEHIIQLMPKYLDAYFYRTHHGAETDLVLVKGNKPIACIEIKFNNQPPIPKGYTICIDDLKTQHNFIITPQSDEYDYKNIRITSLAGFVKRHLKKL
ncbi:MAG: ATP-binding protein [Cytophagaceae bacterium]|nr:ATP-binding protein [Cytophagaceae bacterium]MDW8455846.1 ATP-binding protein [Cytophagaceae bacterium]